MRDNEFNEYVVNETCSGQRIDSFLFFNKAYKSRSLAAKFCNLNKVYVNDKPVSKNYKLINGDIVKCQIAFEDNSVLPQNIPLNIVYEDEFIIVLSKQPGLVCHPAPGQANNTLVNALLYYCGKNNLCNLTGDDSRLGIVHRLDENTSGLMVIAKTNKAGEILSEAMKNHTTSRHYICLVYGIIKQETGKIDVPLIRTLNKRPKIIASNNPKAKLATTSFQTLKRYKFDDNFQSLYDFEGFTLLDCKIHTGRTHQIRSHMEYINHCVVGDNLYDSSSPKNFNPQEILNLNRQFLHSYKLGFCHPILKNYMEFTDNIFSDLQNALNLLNNNCLF